MGVAEVQPLRIYIGGNNTMKLHVINTGFFKLDGGAMFGVVPKSIWQKTNPADENNLCSWAMRCLLIEDGNKLILVDNGIGDKQDARFFSFYYLHGEAGLQSSLRQAGFDYGDITDMFMTHLHFDHCGGGVRYENSRPALDVSKRNILVQSRSLGLGSKAEPT